MARKPDVHWMLNRLVDYQFSMSDFSWPSMAAFCRGYVQQGRAGSKILCPDMPGELVPYQRAFLALDEKDQQIILVKYMPFAKYDLAQKRYRKAHDRDRAKFIGVSSSVFSKRYKMASQEIRHKVANGNPG